MESRASDATASGPALRAPADDEERMEQYLHREVNRDSRAASSRADPERQVLEAIPIARVLHRLEDGRVCDEPVSSLSPEEIEQFREEWDIPSSIPMRGLYPGESACAPRDNFVAVHDNMFRNGFSVPLPQFVQYMLSMLQLAPGQVPPNQWRQLLGLGCLYYLSNMGWPTINEFRALYRLSYSKKAGSSGCVGFTARDYESVITDLPSSINKEWRAKVVLVGGPWQRKTRRHTVPNYFRAIGDQSYSLTETERERIARVYAAWPHEEDRSSYHLTRWVVLAHCEMGRVPGGFISSYAWHFKSLLYFANEIMLVVSQGKFQGVFLALTILSIWRKTKTS